MKSDHDITLLRDAMERTTDGLPPLPDLAPIAVREGRRRRARSRLAAGTAAFAVVTAGALGLTLLPRPGSDVPGVSANVGGEAGRRADYQRRMAALLDELLPPKVTAVRPVKDEVGLYRITVGGGTIRMVASVRPLKEGSAPCEMRHPKDSACAGKELRLGPVGWLCGPGVEYWIGRSLVTLSVNSGTPSVPLTVDDLLAVGQDPRFVKLAKEADARPVEALSDRIVGAHLVTPEERKNWKFCRGDQRAR
ncbi:hypothetical protein [Streptomyces sp. E-08]|uniref:hypothetical protein n=1 Tax=Streptomyces sp. E-08 TaxID=3404047 RepID=UPI003CF586CE